MRETIDVVDTAVAADLAHVIHPLSLMQELEERDLRLFTAGQGLRLQDARGREYLDAVSGLWNVAIGYGRPELGEAAAAVMARIGYSPLYFGRGTIEAATLAAKLAELTPPGIERFFFTSEGSTAVDTAIKFARYEHAQRGVPGKVKIIARWESYHGASIGAVGATGQREFWDDFSIPMDHFRHIRQPRGRAEDEAAELEKVILEEAPETVAAFIAEPVSVPSGVVVPEPNYWPLIRDVCTKYDVRLILDEVVTGFGRTGRMFAAEHWGIRPDLLIMSKGLTSGYFPLAAVGVADDVFENIAQPNRTLMHGFTTGGHPAGCAVALRNIAIIEDEELVARAEEKGRVLAEKLQGLADETELVGAVRSLGLLASIDVALPGAAADDAQRIGQLVVNGMLERCVLLRAYRASIVVAPSLVVSNSEIDEIVGALGETLKTDVAQALGANGDS